MSGLGPFFDGWGPGRLFAAATEFGALAVDHSNLTNVARQLALGDFTSLQENGLLLGWQIMKGGPMSCNRLVTSIISVRKHHPDLASILGPLATSIKKSSKSVIRDVLRDSVGEAFLNLEVPLKRRANSVALNAPRRKTIPITEAASELRVSQKLLVRVAERGDCLIERSKSLYLFDKQKLKSAVRLMNRSLTIYDVSRRLGVPAFAVPALIDAGLLVRITDINVTAMSPLVLIRSESLDSLESALSALTRRSVGDGLVQLSRALGTDLSPSVWAAALSAVLSRKVPVFASRNGGPWACRLLTYESDLSRAVEDARLQPLPDIEIAASVASQIIGFNQACLGRAIREGLLCRNANGIALEELARFREAYVGPGEVSAIYQKSRLYFTKKMVEAGIRPFAKVFKVNLWRRADVEYVFGSHWKRNKNLPEAASAEF